jgi:hypothetical protein
MSDSYAIIRLNVNNKMRVISIKRILPLVNEHRTVVAGTLSLPIPAHSAADSLLPALLSLVLCPIPALKPIVSPLLPQREQQSR